MAYTDINTPVIQKVKLPSGNQYYIADRELRNVVDTLSQTVAGGVSYMVSWDGSDAPIASQIPAGVTVTYNGTTYTGTMEANNATPGAFYLIKSGTDVDGMDVYDEYVPVGSDGNKTWEKIGDTQISLENVVTSVSLNKQTDTAIGTDATFTVTQPTVALATTSGGTGSVQVVTGISSATASGAAVSASGDNVTVVTGYSPSTAAAVKSVSPSTAKLATTTITGVSGSTTASRATSAASQTTADGTGTVSSTNTDWLKGVSVQNGLLTIGAATMDTQTTTQFTFSDVTVPQAAASATTVATGTTAASGSGADVVTTVAVGDTVNVITSLGSPSTDTVIGTGSTFNVTQPTITVTPATTNVKATATGGNVAWNSKDAITVLTDSTDVTVTKGA